MSDRELVVGAETRNLYKVETFIMDTIKPVDCPMKVKTKLKIAVEEIFVNIANYAYLPGRGDATITAELIDDNTKVRITFTDSGKEYNPLLKADPNIKLEARERPIGGLGIFMTKKLVDDILYEYRDNQNVLTIIKGLQ